MMNANNTYFENLKKIGHDWEVARAERQARKQPIIDTYGWDSEELKAWYAEDAKFPFESGVSKAYRAWAQSLSRKEDEVEMDDFLWEKEVTDFIETLRKAGIETFVYTNQSTAVFCQQEIPKIGRKIPYFRIGNSSFSERGMLMLVVIFGPSRYLV